jgi:hypothetical protein
MEVNVEVQTIEQRKCTVKIELCQSVILYKEIVLHFIVVNDRNMAVLCLKRGGGGATENFC